LINALSSSNLLYIHQIIDKYYKLRRLLFFFFCFFLLSLSQFASFVLATTPLQPYLSLSHTNIVLFLHVRFLHFAFCKSVTKALKVTLHRTGLYHDLEEGWNVTRFFALSYCTLGGAQVAGNRHALFFLTQWRRFLPETLTVPQLVNKCSAFYGKPTFITAFTTDRQLSVS
jgi:hypothetical protein